MKPGETISTSVRQLRGLDTVDPNIVGAASKRDRAVALEGDARAFLVELGVDGKWRELGEGVDLALAEHIARLVLAGDSNALTAPKMPFILALAVMALLPADDLPSPAAPAAVAEVALA